jgi:hypothetical protein
LTEHPPFELRGIASAEPELVSRGLSFTWTNLPLPRGDVRVVATVTCVRRAESEKHATANPKAAEKQRATELFNHDPEGIQNVKCPA